MCSFSRAAGYNVGMGIGTSIVIFAIGAILKFATTVHTSAFNLQTIGVILMAVGVAGVVLSLIFWASWGGFGGYSRRRAVYQEPGYSDPRSPGGSPAGRTVVEDDRTRY